MKASWGEGPIWSKRCPLDSASRKTTINTGFHLASTEQEVLLHYGGCAPAAIRKGLSPLFSPFGVAKHKAAQPAVPVAPVDRPVAQVERLARLRESNVLSEEEFQAARAPYVRELSESV